MGEAFDPEYGRMSGFLGLETPNATAGAQNMLLYGYVMPPTEVLRAIELPPGVELTPIATDGLTARRSGRSPTTAWIRTPSTSTCMMCSSSTGLAGMASSANRKPTSSVGKIPCASAHWKIPLSPCARWSPTTCPGICPTASACLIPRCQQAQPLDHGNGHL